MKWNASELSSLTSIVSMSLLTNDVWEVVVIGAGAAGLMAAIRAGERGKRVLLLEKNRRPGVKILMSGGTRCNITQNTDSRGIIAAYGTPGKFLHSPLAAFSVEKTIAFFNEEGVATKVEETGKVFPVSNKAADVLAALTNRLGRVGVPLALDEPVNALEREDGRFVLTTPRRTLLADKVILTSGGQSFPGSGTTGDGYRLTRALGHSLVPPRPALVPITSSVPWIAELRGITIPDTSVVICDGDNRLVSTRGSLLFAHFGLSGPVILDASRVVSGHPDPATLQLEVDFLPVIAEAALDAVLRVEAHTYGKKLLAAIMPDLLPRRLCDVILDLAGLPRDRRAAGLTKDDRNRLVRAIKHARIAITGTMGFGKAEVTAGGIPLDEVDSRSMVSKVVPNLFLAGEVLDLDGPIGGYNFQVAWSTGWLAGDSV
jgi:predicted Rossmann fold flavoprotein